MRSVLGPVLTLLAVSACSSPATLELFYDDELVEAPTRNVDVRGYVNTSCEQLLLTPHGSPAEGEQVAMGLAGYPVAPDADVFDAFPTEGDITLDVAAFDGQNVQIARACRTVAAGADVRLQLRALPECVRVPTDLDITIVLDSSQASSVSDPSGVHLRALTDLVLIDDGFPVSTLWSLIVTDGDGPEEVVMPTTGPRAVRDVIAAGIAHRGATRTFDAVTFASRRIRQRTTCAHRPIMLVIAGGPDRGSSERAGEAQIGLFAERGYDPDDIFTFGVALSEGAFAELQALIPSSVGEVQGGLTEAGVRQAVDGARTRFQDLIDPPN